MMKTICICDRCKKEFPAKKAKRIIFESSLPEKENAGSKIVDMIMTLFPFRYRVTIARNVFLKLKNL